jgi:hypothetical protein
MVAQSLNLGSALSSGGSSSEMTAIIPERTSAMGRMSVITTYVILSIIMETF